MATNESKSSLTINNSNELSNAPQTTPINSTPNSINSVPNSSISSNISPNSNISNETENVPPNRSSLETAPPNPKSSFQNESQIPKTTTNYSTKPKVGTVLGGGSFGTALAQLMARNGIKVNIYVREASVRDSINKNHENPTYLKDIKLSENILAVASVEEAVVETSIILFTIPTQFLREFIVANRIKFPVGIPLVVCAKGIENGTLMFPWEILKDELPGKYERYLACLSGPSFALEVAQSKPTNVTIASAHKDVAETVQEILSDRFFRPYTSSDIIGVEMCGAVKNVLAIASGFSDGMNFGHDARAALITRGLAEITRLAIKKGANPLTMSGLAGIGDLVLTCTGNLSRNWQVGNRMAKGEKLEDIVKSMNMVAEGVKTAASVHEMATKLQIEMPICEQVYLCLYENKPLHQALEYLQSRPLKAEIDFELKTN